MKGEKYQFNVLDCGSYVKVGDKIVSNLCLMMSVAKVFQCCPAMLMAICVQFSTEFSKNCTSLQRIINDVVYEDNGTSGCPSKGDKR